jgi:hypothetical protein
MIVSMLKSEMGFTYKELLYDISYQNLILLSSAIPSYDFDSKYKGKNKRGHGRGGAQMSPTPQKGNAGGLKGLFATLKGE